MPSIALTKETHRNYTNQWRKQLPYGSTHKDKQILKNAIKIYANDPELLGTVIYTMTKNKL